jgi:hypothetical protein
MVIFDYIFFDHKHLPNSSFPLIIPSQGIDGPNPAYPFFQAQGAAHGSYNAGGGAGAIIPYQ